MPAKPQSDLNFTYNCCNIYGENIVLKTQTQPVAAEKRKYAGFWKYTVLQDYGGA
jgi:hypothetical protein